MSRARLTLMFSAALILTTTVSARAASIYDVDFTIDVTNSILHNGTYAGTLAYSDENLTGSGREILGPVPLSSGAPPWISAGLLSVSFEFGSDAGGILDNTYTMADDTGPDGIQPWLIFEHGELLGLDFYFLGPFGNALYGIGKDEIFLSGPLPLTIGSVTYSAPVKRTAAVPAPSAAAGGLALLAGLGLFRRRGGGSASG